MTSGVLWVLHCEALDYVVCHAVSWFAVMDRYGVRKVSGVNFLH
jgi:hypothetical protein